MRQILPDGTTSQPTNSLISAPPRSKAPERSDANSLRATDYRATDHHATDHHPVGHHSANHQAIIETMPNAVFTCDSDGHLTYFNQAAVELWGRIPKLHAPEDRFCGSHQLLRLDGTLLPHDECPMALAIFNGRSTRNEEVSIVRPDGTIIVVEVNIDPLFDEHGYPCGAINVFKDVTRRKQAEDALRHSEERLRLATQAGSIGIFDCDLQTNEAYFSPIYRAITRVNRDSLTMSEWLEMVHPDDRAVVQKTVSQATATGESYHYEYRIFWPDGSLHWLEVHGMVEKNQQGTPVRLTGAMRDVTARKQTEERLLTLYHLRREVSHSTDLAEIYAQALSALQRVLHVDRSAILLADDKGIMRFCAERGLSAAYRQQVEGHSPWAIDESQPQPVLIADVNEADELGALRPIILAEGIHAIAFIPLVEQGQLLGKFMLYYNHPHAFPDDVIQWAQAIASDVAHAIQRKRAEDELRQLNATLEQRVTERTVELERSNRELDQFAYVASHDLKAPLRGISQLASWIEEDASEQLPASSKEHLNKLQGRVKRMDVLLNDLLAYSRAGRQRHAAEPTDFAELIHNVTDMLALPAGFEVHVDHQLPKLMVERVPLESLLRNLISNTVKHHHDPSYGRVEINAQRIGEQLHVTVKDNGPGIEPRFHERIFEMFQTLRPRDQVEGSGLGLALVKKLVESRGGEVTVHSQVGEGAAFHFTWPIAT